jgi:hypothetical protein
METATISRAPSKAPKGAAKPAPRINPLQTQQDGMAFAMALIECAEKRWGIGVRPGRAEIPCDYSAEASAPNPPEHWDIAGKITVFRTGPQSRMLVQAFDVLYERGTRAAILGFHVVWTDFVGGTIAGSVPDSSEYARKPGAAQLEEMPDYRDESPEPPPALGSRDGNFLNMYRELSRWEKIAVYILLQSLAWGKLNKEKTDRMTFAEFHRSQGLPSANGRT